MQIIKALAIWELIKLGIRILIGVIFRLFPKLKPWMLAELGRIAKREAAVIFIFMAFTLAATTSCSKNPGGCQECFNNANGNDTIICGPIPANMRHCKPR